MDAYFDGRDGETSGPALSGAGSCWRRDFFARRLPRLPLLPYADFLPFLLVAPCIALAYHLILLPIHTSKIIRVSRTEADAATPLGLALRLQPWPRHGFSAVLSLHLIIVCYSSNLDNADTPEVHGMDIHSLTGYVPLYRPAMARCRRRATQHSSTPQLLRLSCESATSSHRTLNGLDFAHTRCLADSETPGTQRSCMGAQANTEPCVGAPSDIRPALFADARPDILTRCCSLCPEECNPRLIDAARTRRRSRICTHPFRPRCTVTRWPR